MNKNKQNFILDLGPAEVLVSPSGNAINLLTDVNKVAKAIHNIGEQASLLEGTRTNQSMMTRLMKIYGWARELSHEVGSPDQLMALNMPYLYTDHKGRVEFSNHFKPRRKEAIDFKVRG